jgi:hypothetical protein
MAAAIEALMADSGDGGQGFRLIADSIPIDRGQRSGDGGQLLPSTAA